MTANATLLLTLVAAISTSVMRAQSAPDPKFEVASVKANLSGQPLRMGPTLQPSGRVFAVNLPLRTLVRVAYGLEDNQVVGGPSWMDSSLFDVEARAGANATPEQARAMLRQLLAERFAMAAHAETRQLPIYELTLSARDRKTGSQIRPSKGECTPPVLPQGVPAPPPPPPGIAGVPVAAAALKLTCPTIFFPGHVSARSITIDGFAESLANALRRPVVNRTGLAGNYDIDVSYTPELTAPIPGGIGIAGGGPGGPSGPGAGTTAPSASTTPSLPAALREQLGLRLESSRGPVNVLVIDRVDAPKEN